MTNMKKKKLENKKIRKSYKIFLLRKGNKLFKKLHIFQTFITNFVLKKHFNISSYFFSEYFFLFASVALPATQLMSFLDSHNVGLCDSR